MRGFLAAALLAAFTLPAKADVSDAGSLTIGGQGVIGGTFTVQGSALGVAGSVSATSATLSGTGAQVYALTTSSGIHVINGKLKFDAGAFIEWNDLTKSTTATSSGGAPAASTTTTVAEGTSWTNTSLGPCISTVTLTMSGGKAFVWGSFIARHNTAGDWSTFGILVDGAFIDTKKVITNNSAQRTADDPSLAALSYLSPSTYSGSHTFCLTAATPEGTGYMYGIGYWAGEMLDRWGVFEVN